MVRDGPSLLRHLTALPGMTAGPLPPAPRDCHLALCVDTLNEGIHFFPATAPRDVGYKAVAVNLSDLAAMGARPRGIAVDLTLPAADEDWLGAFAAGLGELAAAWPMAILAATVGTGPLAVTVAVAGTVPRGRALRRAGARPGDDLYVTGTLGDAALAVAALAGAAEVSDAARAAVLPRLHRPEPRVALGLALAGLASAAIDLSDGLLGDLDHVVAASGAAATVDLDALPLSATLGGLPATTALPYALTGGDDYELCFTAPRDRRAEVKKAAGACGVAVTRIGTIEAGRGIRLEPAERAAGVTGGYRHFP